MGRIRLTGQTGAPYNSAFPFVRMKLSSVLRFALLSVVSVAVVGIAQAAAPVFLAEFHLHDFDDEVLKLLGYNAGSLSYLRELASITEDQAKARKAYEAIGCNPFYVMQDGKPVEVGYNCRSFFCVGYQKGPKQCQHANGSAYGGVVEINRRLGLVTINDVQKPFADYLVTERTEKMKQRIAELEPLQCIPFYLQEFDVVVGEGYTCTEIGKYPNYSGKNSCVNDARNKEGWVCDVPYRGDEFDRRRAILGLPLSTTFSSSSTGSSQSSLSSGSGSSVSQMSSSSSSGRRRRGSGGTLSSPTLWFPDVIEGHYGFTAIMSLARTGVIRGYPDGTFQPTKTVNRAEFLHILMNGIHAADLQGEGGCFLDITFDWYTESVCAAKRRGWVGGYSDRKFHPERTMRKAEAIKMVIASLGVSIDSTAELPLGVPGNQWYTPYIRRAVELNILLEPSFNAAADVTRADTAVWMYRALKYLQQ